MENNELWTSVLSETELQISRPNFLTWLKNTKLIKIDAGTALVALPNIFAKEWIETKYSKMILGLVRSHNESVKKIEYVIEGSLVKEIKPKSQIQTEVDKKQLVFQEMKIDPETNLNPRYTINSFVVGSSNEMVFSAAMAVIESVGTKYNPLFIYGGVGLGKTHLIQAIGNEIKNRHDNKIRVKYVSSDKLVNDIVSGIRNRGMEDIKAAYRDVDVLIVDDIQFIGGKPKSEEEFFHIFNTLHAVNKQIIISSDRNPKSLPILEERLRSRFQGGMVADIGYPEYETRVAIIKTKLQEKGGVLSEQIVNMIAEKAQQNIREIEGILNKLIFQQTNSQKELDLSSAEKIVSEATQKSTANITPTHIINAVAVFFEMSAADIISKARNKELIEPRQITVYLLRQMLNMSYPYIATKIGNRDHTTAIYSYKKISEGIAKNQNLNQKIISIKESLSKLG